MLTPFCPQTIECICTYYISVCIRSGLILLLRSLHCIYWDHRAVETGQWGISGFKTPNTPPPGWKQNPLLQKATDYWPQLRSCPISAHCLPNVCPISAQYLPNVCPMSQFLKTNKKISAECPICLPNAHNFFPMVFAVKSWISSDKFTLPSWFSGLPTALDRVVVGKNSSKQMCMTKTGWCCCVTRPHFRPHASSNRAVCSVPRMLPQRYAACRRAAGSMTLDLPRIFLFLPVPVQRLLLIVKLRYCMDGSICNFGPCKEQ